MAEQKITIKGKRKQGIEGLGILFGDLGYSRIAFTNESLTIDKTKGQDLEGKPFLEYRIEFLPDSIVLSYSVPLTKNRTSRLLEVLPILLNVLQLVEEYYDIKPSAIFTYVITVLEEVSKIIDKDSTELSTQLTELDSKHRDLRTKYQELIRASEANTRILLECEQKKEELEKKVTRLRGISDELLKEELYNWIKIHGGGIEIKEFAKNHSIAISRVEDGLNMLIQEGYIKRRLD